MYANQVRINFGGKMLVSVNSIELMNGFEEANMK